MFDVACWCWYFCFVTSELSFSLRFLINVLTFLRVDEDMKYLLTFCQQHNSYIGPKLDHKYFEERDRSVCLATVITAMDGIAIIVITATTASPGDKVTAMDNTANC